MLHVVCCCCLFAVVGVCVVCCRVMFVVCSVVVARVVRCVLFVVRFCALSVGRCSLCVVVC